MDEVMNAVDEEMRNTEDFATKMDFVNFVNFF
jgi:hypothetical protein